MFKCLNPYEAMGKEVSTLIELLKQISTYHG